MGLDDTKEYISHRLKISGGRIPGLFSPGAVKRIYRFSGGIPRLINVACEQALLVAWTRESLTVTPDIAALVIAVAGGAGPQRGLWKRIAGLLFPGK